MREIAPNVKVTQCLAPAVRTADANGSSVDMQGYDSCMFVASVGNSGDTLDASNHIQFSLEESDDNGSFSAVADADITTAVAGSATGTFAKVDDSAAEDSMQYKVSYRGTKRYVRPVQNHTGTHSNGTPTAVLAVQGHAAARPVA